MTLEERFETRVDACVANVVDEAVEAIYFGSMQLDAVLRGFKCNKAGEWRNLMAVLHRLAEVKADASVDDELWGVHGFFYDSVMREYGDKLREEYREILLSKITESVIAARQVEKEKRGASMFGLFDYGETD